MFERKGKDVVDSICKGLQTESIGGLRYESIVWFEGETMW